MHNKIGTNLVFENEKVKVWELFLEPGQQLELHHHQLEYIFIEDMQYPALLLP
jgi:hypothetical protein